MSTAAWPPGKRRTCRSFARRRRSRRRREALANEETNMLNRFFQQPTGTPETDVTHAIEARTKGAAQIVDVREPDEWAEGRIPGAIHIPLGSLASRANELDPG